MKSKTYSAVDSPEHSARIRDDIRVRLAGMQNPAPSSATAHTAPGSLSQASGGKTDAPHDYRLIATSDLVVDAELDKGDDLTVMLLTASIADRGVLHAPLVQKCSAQENKYMVLDGKLRCEAVTRLGIPSIVCRVIGGSELDAELAGIDEKLACKSPDPKETAAILNRRTEIYRALNARSGRVDAHPAFARLDQPGATDVASGEMAGASVEPAVRSRWLSELRNASAEIDRINGGGAPAPRLELDAHSAMRGVDWDGAEAVPASAEPATLNIEINTSEAGRATSNNNSPERPEQNSGDRTKAENMNRLQDEIELLSESLTLQMAWSTASWQTRDEFLSRILKAASESCATPQT